jgi:hypothetical protein
MSDAAVAEVIAAQETRAARLAALRAARSRERRLALLTGAFVELAAFCRSFEAHEKRGVLSETDARRRELAGPLGHAIVDQIAALFREAASAAEIRGPAVAAVLQMPSPLAGEGMHDFPARNDG